METKLKGGKSFSHVEVKLKPGEEIITEPGAMASMDAGVDLRTKINGHVFRALTIKFLGKESIFINRLTNNTQKDASVVLTQPTPGEIDQVALNGGSLYLQPGAFLACTSGVKFGLRWAGITSWMAGEGLFRLKISGHGTCWYGAYGSIVEKKVVGSYLIDNGHLLSYPTHMKLKLQLAGGLVGSFLGGEGFVARIEGNGIIKMQTRSIGGLAGWLNPKF